VVPDASELVVESAPVKHFPAHGSDLVQSVGPNGDMAWTLFVKPRADIEKPEPVSDRTEMDH
jgi:hypothetical protein